MTLQTRLMTIHARIVGNHAEVDGLGAKVNRIVGQDGQDLRVLVLAYARNLARALDTDVALITEGDLGEHIIRVCADGTLQPFVDSDPSGLQHQQPARLYTAPVTDPDSAFAALTRVREGGDCLVVLGFGSSAAFATAFLSGVFGSYRGRGVLAWENSNPMGVLTACTESGAHTHTEESLGSVLSTQGLSLSALEHFVHKQTADRYSVLRGHHATQPRTFSTILAGVRRRYPMLVMSTGAGRGGRWMASIKQATRLVVATASEKEAVEATVQMLQMLSRRDAPTHQLVAEAVVVVLEAKKQGRGVTAAAHEAFAGHVGAIHTIPYDAATESGTFSLTKLRARTRDAWISAAVDTVTAGSEDEAH